MDQPQICYNPLLKLILLFDHSTVLYYERIIVLLTYILFTAVRLMLNFTILLLVHSNFGSVENSTLNQASLRKLLPVFGKQGLKEEEEEICAKMELLLQVTFMRLPEGNLSLLILSLPPFMQLL